MTTFANYINRHFGVTFPTDREISAQWFHENLLPMVVQCTCCQMTMASPSAYVDDDGYTYCADCAGVEEDDEFEPGRIYWNEMASNP